nr:MAG TPA: chitin synthase regulator [Caudoviricetes sp.]
MGTKVESISFLIVSAFFIFNCQGLCHGRRRILYSGSQPCLVCRHEQENQATRDKAHTKKRFRQGRLRSGRK